MKTVLTTFADVLQFCRHVIGCKTRVKFITSDVSLIARLDTAIVDRSILIGLVLMVFFPSLLTNFLG